MFCFITIDKTRVGPQSHLNDCDDVINHASHLPISNLSTPDTGREFHSKAVRIMKVNRFVHF